MLKQLIFFSFGLMCGHNLMAQSNQSDLRSSAPKIIPPSPEGASLGKYGDIPVSLYTGVPSISIPIWNLKSRELELPISIDYHASGIKVDELASNVGLGWSLNAGGLITKSVMGQPDGEAVFERVPFPEELVTDLNSDGINDFTTLYHTYGQAVVSGLTDSEPDLYYFNILGKSGKFLYDHLGNVKIIPYQAILINRNLSTGVFTIIDENGWKYFFEPGESMTVRSKLLFRGTQPSNYTPPPVVNSISSYVLTKIKSTDNDSILFNYEQYSYSYKSSLQESDYTVLPEAGCSQGDAPLRELWERTNYVAASRLKEIRTATGLTVFFEYQNSPRLDIVAPSSGLPNSSLSAITIKNMFNETIKRFDLSYDYFKTPVYETLASDQKNLHCKLKLESLTESGKPPYRLAYFESPSFPERFSLMQDHWGYFNQNPAATLLPSVFYGSLSISGADRRPNLNYARVGTLRTIRYPTGGKTEFEFEMHDYATVNNIYEPPQPVTQGAGISVSFDPEAPTEERNTFTIPADAIGGTGGGGVDCTPSRPIAAVLTTTNSNGIAIQLPGIAGSAMAFINGPDGFRAVSSGNNSSTICVAPGTYTATATASGTYDPSLGEIPAWAGISLTWYLPATSSTTVVNVPIGGLRVSSTVDKDINDNVIKTQKYDYRKPGTTESSGVLANVPQIGYVADITKIVTSDNLPITCQFYVRESQSSVPLGTIKGSNVAYEFVTVSDTHNGDNGRTVYQYSRIPNLAPEKSYPLAPSVDNDWIRGLLVKKSVFKKVGASFNEVLREENNYKVYHDPYLFWGFRQTQANPFVIDFGEQSDIQDGAPYIISTTPPGYNKESNVLCMKLEEAAKISNQLSSTTFTVYNYTYYKYVSAFYHLFRSKQTIFGDNNTQQVTEKRYYFDNEKHLLPTRVAIDNSDGSTQMIITKYTSDYDNLVSTSSDAMVKAMVYMQSTNQISKPLESQVWLKKNAIFSIRSAKLNSYALGNKATRMDAQFSMPNPSGPSFVNSYITASGQFVRDTRYIRDVSFNKYSSEGLLTDFQPVSGERISVLYGYNKSLPIARAVNASSDQIFHTSFEEPLEGNSILGDSKTGDRSKTDGFTKVISNLPNGSYQLSYWQKNAGNWVMSMQSVNVTTGNFTINLTGQVDEVKLYPTGAQMETYTNKQGVGITSACDSKGYLTYYQYDSAGRLQAILDEAGNVVKSLNYNYYKP
jgi:hypothetical protein